MFPGKGYKLLKETRRDGSDVSASKPGPSSQMQTVSCPANLETSEVESLCSDAGTKLISTGSWPLIRTSKVPVRTSVESIGPVDQQSRSGGESIGPVDQQRSGGESIGPVDQQSRSDGGESIGLGGDIPSGGESIGLGGDIPSGSESIGYGGDIPSGSESIGYGRDIPSGSESIGHGGDIQSGSESIGRGGDIQSSSEGSESIGHGEDNQNGGEGGELNEHGGDHRMGNEIEVDNEDETDGFCKNCWSACKNCYKFCVLKIQKSWFIYFFQFAVFFLSVTMITIVGFLYGKNCSKDDVYSVQVSAIVTAVFAFVLTVAWCLKCWRVSHAHRCWNYTKNWMVFFFLAIIPCLFFEVYFFWNAKCEDPFDTYLFYQNCVTLVLLALAALIYFPDFCEHVRNCEPPAHPVVNGGMNLP